VRAFCGGSGGALAVAAVEILLLLGGFGVEGLAQLLGVLIRRARRRAGRAQDRGVLAVAAWLV